METKNIVENVRGWYRELPDKKKYVELISAVLSVPVLVTVILINVNNLTQKNTAKSTDKLTPSYFPSVTIIEKEKESSSASDKLSPSPTNGPTPTTFACKKEVGPVAISAPQENQVITNDPVSIDINTQTGDFCPVVWAYSLDGGTWSAFSDKNISLYNLNNGDHQVNIKVKSTASDNEIMLRRTFYYNNPNNVTIAPTQPATTSALVQ